MTYGDMSHWPFPDQYRALTHAREVEREFKQGRPRTREGILEENGSTDLLYEARYSDGGLRLALEEYPEWHISKAIDRAT